MKYRTDPTVSRYDSVEATKPKRWQLVLPQDRNETTTLPSILDRCVAITSRLRQNHSFASSTGTSSLKQLVVVAVLALLLFVVVNCCVVLLLIIDSICFCLLNLASCLPYQVTANWIMIPATPSCYALRTTDSFLYESTRIRDATRGTVSWFRTILRAPAVVKNINWVYDVIGLMTLRPTGFVSKTRKIHVQRGNFLLGTRHVTSTGPSPKYPTPKRWVFPVEIPNQNTSSKESQMSDIVRLFNL